MPLRSRHLHLRKIDGVPGEDRYGNVGVLVADLARVGCGGEHDEILPRGLRRRIVFFGQGHHVTLAFEVLLHQAVVIGFALLWLTDNQENLFALGLCGRQDLLRARDEARGKRSA